MAVTELAHLRAFRPGRRHPADSHPLPGASRVLPSGADLGRDRVRRIGRRAERRYRPDQRQPRRPADRCHARPDRGHRGPMAAHRGPAGGLGRFRAFAGWRRPDRRRHRRRRHGRWRRPGTHIAAAVVHVHRGAGPLAARPGSSRGHRGAVPGRRDRHAAGRRAHRRDARGTHRPRPGPGHRRAGGRRHAAAVHAVRLRAEPRVRRGGRRLP